MTDSTDSDRPDDAGAGGKRAADTMAGVNTYHSYLTDEQVANNVHRSHIGGLWDTMGTHQLDFLVEQGLKPNHTLVDIGCGAMRGGVQFARYLDIGNYYGTDINERLIEVGLDVEMPAAGLADRVKAENFKVTPRFNADFGVKFDYAIAQSVFSHLPLNHIRVCLAQTAKVMAPGGRFYATFFRVPEDHPYPRDFNHGQIVSHTTSDPFHYRVSELKWAARVAQWDFTYIGDWNHPRGQEMALFTKRTGAAAATADEPAPTVTPARTGSRWRRRG